MFNVRVEPALEDAIVKAAERAGLRKSVWAREVLLAAASGLFDPMLVRSEGGTVSPHPARFLALQAGEAYRAQQAGTCVHPPTALKELPFTDVCGLCGTVIRNR